MMNRFIIRSDGGKGIGLGHLSRCFSLAKIIRKHFDITFVIKQSTQQYISKIIQDGFMVLQVDNEDWIKDISSNDIVLLDGYHFDIEFQEKIQHQGSKLIIMDDIYDRPLSADLVINYAPNAQDIQYSPSKIKNLALGIDFLILNEEFLNLAKRSFEKTISNHAFLCLGGADKNNFTEKALMHALDHNYAEKYSVILGPYFQFDSEIYDIADKHPEIKVYKAPSQEEILKLMLECDKAICASGTLALEYICTGGLLGIIKIAENQNNIYEFLITNHLAFNFFESKPLVDYSAMVKNQKNLINGKSNENLLKVILDLQKE